MFTEEFGICLMLRQAQHDERFTVTLSLSKCSINLLISSYIDSIAFAVTHCRPSRLKFIELQQNYKPFATQKSVFRFFR